MNHSSQHSINQNRRLITAVVYAVSLGLYMLNAISAYWVDEFDNLLGGRVLANGGQLYADFFSHHMPFPYYVGAALHLLAGDNTTMQRVLWSLLLFMMIALLHVFLRKTSIAGAYYAFPLLFPAVSVFFTMHSLLAETIVSYAVFGVVLILFFRVQQGDTSIVTPVVLGGLLFVIPTSSLIYAPLAGVLGLIMLYYLARARGLGLNDWKAGAQLLAQFLLLPMGLTAFYVLTGHPRELFEQAYVFNTEHYANYTLGSPSQWQWPFYFTLGTVRYIATVVGEFAFAEYSITTGLICALIAGLVIYAMYGSWDRVMILGIVTVLIFNPRVETVGPNTDFLFHLGPFFMFTLFNIVILAHYLHRHGVLSFHQRIHSGGQIALVVLTLLWAFFVFRGVGSVLHYSADNYWRILVYQQDPLAQVELRSWKSTQLESILEDGDPVWIGPYQPGTYLALPDNPVAASQYFALPWTQDSEKHTTTLMTELELSQPPVMLVDLDGDIWGYPTRTWATALIDYLDRHYFSVADPALDQLYFRRDQADELIRRLAVLGYDATIRDEGVMLDATASTD